MEVEIKNQIMECSGLLNEKSDMAAVSNAFDTAMAGNGDAFIRIDMSKVLAANSVGLLGFTKVMRAKKARLKYINAPVWLVNNLNCLQEFFMNDSTVESIFADFYCPTTNKSSVQHLTIGKEIPVQEDYSEFSISLTDSAGNALEMDFDPEDFFSFIAVRPEAFKS